MNIPPVVEAILLVEAIILLHEGAHAWVAASLGMRINKVVIGLPIFPTWTLHFGSTPVVLSPWLVMGGVIIDEDDFWGAPLWKKVIVATYGPMGNIIGAMLVTFAVFGLTQGLALCREVSLATVQFLGLFFTGKVNLSDITGPIDAIAVATRIVTIDETMGLIFIWLLLNFAVATVNIIPIPGLDGGHYLVGAFYSMVGKWPKLQSMTRTTTNGFTYGLIFVVVLLTVRDVLHLF